MPAQLEDVYEKLGKLSGKLDTFSENVSGRLTAMDQKIDVLQSDVNKLNSAFSGMKVKIAGISGGIASVMSFAVAYIFDHITGK